MQISLGGIPSLLCSSVVKNESFILGLVSGNLDIWKISLPNHYPHRIWTCEIRPFKEIRPFGVTFACIAGNSAFSESDFDWSLHRCQGWDYRMPNPKYAGELSLFSSLRHKETWTGKRCGHTANQIPKSNGHRAWQTLPF